MAFIHSREPRFLIPVPMAQWREPSLAQFKDQFNNPGVQIRFRLRCWRVDGPILDEHWYDDRYEFDNELFKITIEEPHNDIWYEFATVTFLTTTGSNQTYNKPSDWNDADNTIEGLAGGGSGGALYDSTQTGAATGGGGSAYSKITNFTFSGGSLTYRVGSAGAGVSRSTAGATAGNAGTLTYFNASADPGTGTDNTKLAVNPGGAGQASTSTAGINGGTAGTNTNCWGQIRTSGGRGGNSTATGSNFAGTGGGGAAGPTGIGGDGADTVAASHTGPTNGGSANGGTTAGSVGVSQSNSAPGNSGTEWDGSHGCGSGSGGSFNTNSASFSTGVGGNYGAGSGGCWGTENNTKSSGNGAQGLIVVTYTPPSQLSRRLSGIPGTRQISPIGGSIWAPREEVNGIN